MKNFTKHLAPITIITLLFMVSSCAFFNKLLASKNKAGVDKTATKTDKNLATAYESNNLELNMIANSGQTTNIDLLLDDTKTSFSLDFQKQGNNESGSYSISQKENQDISNPNKITFAGKLGYIKKYQLDDEFDEKAFTETSKIFLQGSSTSNYITTIPNSLTFNDTNFVAFKIENKETNKTNYGWLNLVINADKVTIVKMGYLDKLPLSIGN
jgi:predicted double-glycine peptidase